MGRCMAAELMVKGGAAIRQRYVSKYCETAEGGEAEGCFTRRFERPAEVGEVIGVYEGVPLDEAGVAALRTDGQRRWAEEYAASGGDGVTVVAIPNKHLAAAHNEPRNEANADRGVQKVLQGLRRRRVRGAADCGDAAH